MLIGHLRGSLVQQVEIVCIMHMVRGEVRIFISGSVGVKESKEVKLPAIKEVMAILKKVFKGGL